MQGDSPHKILDRIYRKCFFLNIGIWAYFLLKQDDTEIQILVFRRKLKICYQFLFKDTFYD